MILTLQNRCKTTFVGFETF